jgi:hypothetical protein
MPKPTWKGTKEDYEGRFGRPKLPSAVPPPGHETCAKFATRIGAMKYDVDHLRRLPKNPLPSVQLPTGYYVIPIKEGLAWVEQRRQNPPDSRQKKMVYTGQAVERFIDKLDAANMTRSVVAFRAALEVFKEEVIAYDESQIIRIDGDGVQAPDEDQSG